MSAQALDRVTFSVSRAADFLEARALVSQTGQPEARFGDVVLKELLDNALDAAESARVAPDIEITLDTTGNMKLLTVSDNGTGIPPGVVARVLDFTSLTSDKALYRSPCRGAQGNALKTMVGIPRALGVADPIIIEAQGTRHTVSVALATTSTAEGARKVLAGWDGPASVRDSALKLLDELTTATTEEVTASRSPGVA